jgi:hypothetical protein
VELRDPPETPQVPSALLIADGDSLAWAGTGAATATVSATNAPSTAIPDCAEPFCEQAIADLIARLPPALNGGVWFRTHGGV